MIVGIADENLDSIASKRRLRRLFDNDKGVGENAGAKKYYDDFHALVRNPALSNPRIFYLDGEHMLGSQIGVGLGYVIFEGNLNDQPKRLDEALFGRVDELKRRFVRETKAKSLKITGYKVGVYALNVRDT